RTDSELLGSTSAAVLPLQAPAAPRSPAAPSRASFTRRFTLAFGLLWGGACIAYWLTFSPPNLGIPLSKPEKLVPVAAASSSELMAPSAASEEPKPAEVPAVVESTRPVPTRPPRHTTKPAATAIEQASPSTAGRAGDPCLRSAE